MGMGLPELWTFAGRPAKGKGVKMMKFNEEDDETLSAFARTEQWKMFKWIWDNLQKCPWVENIPDVDAQHGTMQILSSEGDTYNLTITKDKWRQIR